jgi:two-component system alkaline phosphatase synthesis response regulator PhoP
MRNFGYLVVEDEEDLNEILQFNLESEGYQVDTSFSAEEALKRDLTIYQLMILDVMMGKISGFSLAQRSEKSCGSKFQLSSSPQGILKTIY